MQKLLMQDRLLA